MPIVGTFRDFNTGEPAIVMALERYRRDWRDDELTGIGVDLDADADAAAVEAGVRALVGSVGRVRSSARLEELSLAVFDRTFRVTEVLRVLAGIVAFLGILSALLAIELERARELSVLRTLGFYAGRARRDAAHADGPARRSRRGSRPCRSAPRSRCCSCT